LLALLLQGIALGFSAAVSPGPFQAYLLAQTTAHGPRRTLPAAFAPLLSDGPIILIVLFILAQLPPWFLRLLNLAGGVLLLYLAYGAFRTFQHYSGGVLTVSTGSSILQAALVNALAPGPWVFWSVLAGPLLIKGLQESLAAGLAFLFGFYVLLIGGNACFIVLYAGARRLGPNAMRLLNAGAAVALGIFGALQIWRGLAGA
jgi:threonine/homoserine/homoserine lactone efflux protein